jgi:LCP family protein required for cell wall assembly
MMLLRADPETKSISMLSFPRDLIAPVWCGETAYPAQRINQAYALCGSKGALDTVKKLTGLPVNYLITVNFKGFIEIVDRVGGVWVDVDRRYFNRNVGTEATNYANIDLRPGYQRLKGRDALSYVRFRHTDSDLYRLARQQQFVKALKADLGASHLQGPRSWSDHAQRRDRAGRGALARGRSGYALFAQPAVGHFFQSKIDGLMKRTLRADGVDPTAVQEFERPTSRRRERHSGRVRQGRGQDAAPSRLGQMLNGNGVAPASTPRTNSASAAIRS